MDPNERFARFWTGAQPVVASFIGALMPDFRDAQDLLQNVAAACLRKFNEYDPERPFTAWALGVARFEVLRLRRTQVRSPLLFNDDLVARVATACDEAAPELERRARALPQSCGILPYRLRTWT
jgi:RNA polymerase sigma-70 factor (ECF subfamily)